jgi:uncharacterized protein YbjT (DUF2867 family)
MRRIAVTGATGHVGGAVARALSAEDVPTRLVVRDPARAPQLPGAEVAVAAYGDTDALARAFEGADALLLVSAAEHADRLGQHRSAVEAAARAGVPHVVYTSFARAAPDAVFTLARDHWATEQALVDAGIVTTALRNSFYADVLPSFFEGGAVRGPAGDGRIAAVARRDVADAAVAVLLHPSLAGRPWVLTGPEALSFDEVAAQLSAVVGAPLRYERETVEQAYASRAHHGVEPFQLDAWVSTYTAIAAGEVEDVTGDVEALTGRPATSFGQLLLERPHLWQPLLG